MLYDEGYTCGLIVFPIFDSLEYLQKLEIFEHKKKKKNFKNFFPSGKKLETNHVQIKTRSYKNVFNQLINSIYSSTNTLDFFRSFPRSIFH